MNDLDDLLARSQATHDLRADGSFPDAGHKVLHNLVVDIGLKQREANLAHGKINISFGQFAALLQVIEDGL